MPDGIPAVGAQVRSPDPAAGINNYSSMLGIQQQRQALQTGQYTQQSAQATADQDQQKNRELQAAQKLAMNGAQSGRYAKADGSFDRQKMADEISQVAPTYGQGIASTLLSQANEVVSNHQALQNLNQDQQKQVSAAIAPLASKADVTHEDFINALDSIADINPATRRMAISMGASIPPNASPAQLQQFARQLAMKATSPEYNATQTQPNVGLVQGVGADGQPGLVPTNTNPQAPGGVGQVGPVQKQSLAPTEQLPYVRARGAAGVEGTQGASNDEALYNDIVQKGTKAVQLKALTQDIRNLSSEVQTGQYSKAMADKWSALKQTFGFKPTDDSFETKRQILAKMAAQLRTQSEAGASTDSERNGIAAALPDPEHMGPAAVGQAARYVGALADSNAARARFANQHRQVGGGQSTGIREADSAFMQNADPRVFEYQGIPAGQERQAYLKQHFKSKEEVKAFLDKQQALKSYGAIQ